jgi:hypothetical protein
MKRGRKKLPVQTRTVQGAYVLKTTKVWLKKQADFLGYHSPSEFAGAILDEHAKIKRKKKGD